MIDGGLRKHFMDKLPEIHWQCIESGSVGGGIPDTNYCHAGCEGWIEFKRTKGWAIKFQPFQVGWHERRNRAGGRTFIAVRRQCVSTTLGKIDQIWLYRGEFVRSLEIHGLKTHRPPVLLADGGPTRWPWRDIEKILASP